MSRVLVTCSLVCTRLNHQPIQPLTFHQTSLLFDSHQLKMCQHPNWIELAWALIVYKVQGIDSDQAVVDLGVDTPMIVLRLTLH